MYRTVLFILVLFIGSIQSISVFASNDIDSLKQQLENVSDNRKSALLNRLSLEYLNVSPQRSIDYAYQSLLFAQRFKNYNDLADAMKTIASINYQIGMLDSAIYYNKLALELYENIEDSTGISKVLNNFGIFYNALGNYEKAITYHLQSLNIKQNLQDSSGIAYSCNNIGVLYYQLGKYQTALNYFEKALSISQSINDKNNEQSSLSNIGLIYFNLKLYDKAIEVLLKSNEINNLLNKIQNVSNNLVLIGNIYSEKKMYEEALEYYLRSQNLNESYGINEPETLYFIAVLFDSLKEYGNSLKYYSRAYKMAGITNDKDILLKSGKSISRSFSAMGKWQDAYESLLLYIKLEDSLSNDKTKYPIEDSAIYRQTSQIDTSVVKENPNDTIVKLEPSASNDSSNTLVNKILFGSTALLLIALLVLIIRCRKNK